MQQSQAGLRVKVYCVILRGIGISKERRVKVTVAGTSWTNTGGMGLAFLFGHKNNSCLILRQSRGNSNFFPHRCCCCICCLVAETHNARSGAVQISLRNPLCHSHEYALANSCILETGCRKVSLQSSQPGRAA